MDLSYLKFSEINLDDKFFDSLKEDYAEFEDWFKRKSSEHAYVLKNEDESIDGFLYVKIETGAIDDIKPALPPKKRVKIGTLKINPHGTRLGERFIKKSVDHAITKGIQEIYVTIFEKHTALVSIFQKYGFQLIATKTTKNGTEIVLLKDISNQGKNPVDRYPLIKKNNQTTYLISLYPAWHTRLLPDSILKNEDTSIVQDISHTNSIHKVYLSSMSGLERVVPGDILLIYRTTDNLGPAHYRSVATSICVVEEYTNINKFNSEKEFVNYCSPYSVFSHQELLEFWKSKKYQHVLRFTYNLSLPRRVTRGRMIENMGFDPKAYWGFMQISDEQLRAVVKAGELDENLIID